MYNFSRKKRITDAFDDEAKARIFGRFEPGSVSSGSEHSSHKFDEEYVASPNLSGVLFESETEIISAESNANNSNRNTESLLDHDSARGINELKLIFARDINSDTFKDVLKANIVKSMDMFSCLLEQNKSILRRNIMSFLRNLGYNAAICKTKWETCGGLNAGNYEFIDIVKSDVVSSTRYFIDLDFMSEFQLARQTERYEEMLKVLPRFFVGNGEELKQILRIVSDGSRLSLKSGGLHIPPWRKHRFMQQKYFGPYKRTVNLFPATFGSGLPCSKVVVKCRAVGFDDSGVNGRLFPAATRSR